MINITAGMVQDRDAAREPEEAPLASPKQTSILSIRTASFKTEPWSQVQLASAGTSIRLHIETAFNALRMHLLAALIIQHSSRARNRMEVPNRTTSDRQVDFPGCHASRFRMQLSRANWLGPARQSTQTSTPSNRRAVTSTTKYSIKHQHFAKAQYRALESRGRVVGLDSVGRVASWFARRGVTQV